MDKEAFPYQLPPPVTKPASTKWRRYNAFLKNAFIVLALFAYYVFSSVSSVSPVSPVSPISPVSPAGQPPVSEKKSFEDETRKLGLKELRTGKFYPEIDEIQWIPSEKDKGTFLTRQLNKYVVNKIGDDDFQQVLYNSRYFKYDNVKYYIEDLEASPNLKFAILTTNKASVWRHSSVAHYWILNIETRVISPVMPKTNDAFPLISFVKWAPNSNHMAFVYENNVYVKDMASDKISQVTSDGGPNFFNGKPDWVYEEEVFGTYSAVWWSPNSRFLAYLKFNDSEVKEFPLNFFAQDQSSYPLDTRIKYPKAGYKNPEISMNIYNVAINESSEIFNNMGKAYKDFLATEILWVGNDKMLLKTTNRVSTILKTLIVDTQELNVDIVREETTNNGWFEITQNAVFVSKDLSKGRPEDGYIDTISVDGYNHLAYFTPINSSDAIILTSGEFEVDGGVTSFDSETNKVYFIATKRSSMDRHLYSVDLVTHDFIAITDDSDPGFYQASFSTDSKFALISYMGPDIPYQKIIELTSTKNDVFLFNKGGKNLTNNEKLAEHLKNFDLPTTELSEISIGTDANGEEIIANCRVIKPYGFDENSKYPLFVYVYQGPNSQLITRRFSVGILQVIASTLNAVVVTVDGRGTGFKGKQFRSVVYKNLSHYETIDQINAAKKFASLKFIDPERTLIYGHSYGGYMTLKTLENDKDKVFKYGISGAPVTDWKLYDSIYTERYMDVPQNNSENYYTGAVGNFNISNFQSTKRFLMIHGTGDDNVHIQNLYKLIDKLNLNNIENNFDLMIFPDSNHGVSFHNAGYIMYNKILWWAKMAFSGEFDNFGEYDYHNGNLAAVGITSYKDEDDAKYLVSH